MYFLKLCFATPCNLLLLVIALFLLLMCAVYDVLPISKSPLLSVKIFLGAYAYHLGSATDDNPLAVLASQNMQGLSEGLFIVYVINFVYLARFHITVTSLSSKVTSLFTPLSLHFYEKSHYFFQSSFLFYFLCLSSLLCLACQWTFHCSISTGHTQRKMSGY